MPNFSRYVGIPYAALDYPGYNGLDCWHLVREVLHAEYQIEIPCLAYGDPLFAGNLLDHFERDYRRFLDEWQQVEKMEEADLLLFSNSGVASHAAIAIDKRSFLHTTKATGAVIEKLDDYWRSKLYCVYRHRSRARVLSA